MKSPVTRAALGIAALVAIAILVNWLVSLTALGSRGADFTENKTHTLSDGTRAILGELDAPVVIRYYASRSAEYMPQELKLYQRRIDDTLKEYASLSNGKIRIERLDPKPDTDAEDAANLDGITAQPIGSDPIYLGIAVSCLDRTRVLPFLNPQDETLLEYHLSKAISDVTTASKPTIAVMSSFNLKGEPPMMPGQPPDPGWVIYQQLEQSFEVSSLPMEPVELDPGKTKVLLVLHPSDITPAVEYSIDQYLLKGGTVVACVDPYSVAAQLTPGNPLTGSKPSMSSNLPTLFPAWGIQFDATRSLADPAYATPMGQNVGSIAVLTLPQEALPQKDNVVTKDLSGITFLLAGGLTYQETPGIAYTSLIRTTQGAGFVDSSSASRLDPALARTFRSSGTAYDLAIHLSGKFKTAFPNGNPNAPAKSEENADDSKDESLKEATTTGNVFIIADADAFFDRFAYTVQTLGNMQLASPINGNSTFLFNLLDQATGSKHLIGSRSRAAIRRPFTVIRNLEAEFNKNVGAKIEEFQSKQQAAQQKLNELQAQKTQGNEFSLSPAQEEEIKKLRAEQVEYARMIREQEKDLRRQKDALASKITLLNVAVMPFLVVLAGLSVYLRRRSSTRSR
ncbi:MAG: GldG family protein [Luteolibacter sp.]